MSQYCSLSARYIHAMQQLPQYGCVLPSTDAETLTHVLTGVRISALGDLQDPDGTSGLLAIEYPGGHKSR